jgi:hypothetical protein
MNQYDVSVHVTLDDMADPVDAVGAMAAWLSTDAYKAGYRVIDNATGEETFIDAEGIDWNEGSDE